jgi:hypothetical protein
MSPLAIQWIAAGYSRDVILMSHCLPRHDVKPWQKFRRDNDSREIARRCAARVVAVIATELIIIGLLPCCTSSTASEAAPRATGVALPLDVAL